MKSKVILFQDEIDAQIAATAFMDSVKPKHWPSSIETIGFVREGGMRIDGGLQMMWSCNNPIAQTSIIRNDANWSILTCVHYRESMEED